LPTPRARSMILSGPCFYLCVCMCKSVSK
jgi:hypothetical protein